ncbi:DEAD/DEAH box helicase family protein [Nonomuraea sp. NPDC050663]|uniref:DEAD/DEAH box helicase family protein n=1 Tax=Nonomuraea sp. NPDC050663 TaxID=3364370 RepID=UPI00378F4800
MFADLRPPYELHKHQIRALSSIESAFADGRRRAWVVLPPGAGKTLTGLEAARRLGEPAVAFGPNTAIQGQWMREWNRFGGTAGSDVALSAPLTVLTYQALASFDPEAEVAEEGGERSHLVRLRPRGRELVAALQAAGDLTLLLDECHHLLDTWGELLAEVLELLPRARVIGLTATPPDRLTAVQAELVGRLFGPVIQGPSIPAVVRDARLAPYAELAWLTEPTPREQDWLAAEAERFTELTTDLLDPGFADVPFLEWLERRLVRREVEGRQDALPWARLERQEPELAQAGLRFHCAGLLPLPEGARIREEHRQPPTADDWICLIGDYVRRCLRPRGQAAAVEAIRAALPSVGYQLTARGVRAGRSPIDRVVARSEAKVHAVAEILAAEHDNLGERLRGLVVCDHERATATLPARLAGALDEQAGSARLVLETLVADKRTAQLSPMLVTGRTVAAGAETARAFAAFCSEESLHPVVGEGVVEITGSWTSRTWVALATRFLQEGGTQVLIGTRAMLGEGWDAASVNTLVDLSEATTATSVVQTRGRALRLDPSWPAKVAHTWSVVCVSRAHPKGLADWDRFVRKHDGYLGITDNGAIMAGVAHVHPVLSPYGPPEQSGFDALNVSMLERARDRRRVRKLWRIGTPYEDVLTHVLRVTPARPTAAEADGWAPPTFLPAVRGIEPRPDDNSTNVAAATTGALASTSWVLSEAGVGWALLAGLPLAAFAGWRVRSWRRARLGRMALEEVAERLDLAQLAYALADALRRCDLADRGAEAVRVEPDGSGSYQVTLAGVRPAQSALFSRSLDELISPPVRPRYLIPRYIVTPGPRQALALMAGEPEPNAVVYHAVPEALAANGGLARVFSTAWNTWVSAGRAVFADNPKGAALLVAQGGGSPLDVSTALRLAWE